VAQAQPTPEQARAVEAPTSAPRAAPLSAPHAAPDAADAAVEVRDLVKRYPKGHVNALDGVTFSVAKGEVFGLLGPNGAGKTTTVGILTTRVVPTGGSARVAGIDVVKDPAGARKCLAVVSQLNNLDRSLSIKQNLLFHAAYHGVPAAERKRRAAALLEQFGLADRANDKVDWVSGGQAQRIMISRALMHDPEVLFLDEPTTGLDPAARLFVWDRINDLRRRGVTVFLTTHDMDEAAELTDRVGIVDHGRLLALDSPAALTRALSGRTTLEVSMSLDGTAPASVLAALAELDGVERAEQVDDTGAGGFGGGAANPFAAFMGGGSTPPPGEDGPPGPAAGAAGERPTPSTLTARLYVTRDAPLMVPPVASLLARHGVTLTGVRIGEPSLEDVFIALTGRALR
jgi:ABC-2 type transport system ATP-binding protein